MAVQIELGELRVAVVRKPIRNLHLSVHPPQGQVRIAAPPQMKLDTIRVFVISRLAWIKDQQRMSMWLPHWQHLRQVLNRLPVRHEDWGY
jgi:predicted metal-dependent hydrolase